jgi:Tol biopolymer transport system component
LTVDADIGLGIGVSPDGLNLAFSSQRDGKYAVWTADANGKNMHRLTDGPEDVYPAFMAGGRVLFQRGLNNGTITFWQAAPGSGEPPVQITKNHSIHPAVSPEGTRVAYYFMDREDPDHPVWRIGIASAATGELLGKLDFPKFVTERQLRWLPDGRSIVQVYFEGDNAGLMVLPVDGGKPIMLPGLGKFGVDSISPSPDGRQAILATYTETRDAVVMTGF